MLEMRGEEMEETRDALVSSFTVSYSLVLNDCVKNLGSLAAYITLLVLRKNSEAERNNSYGVFHKLALYLP